MLGYMINENEKVGLHNCRTNHIQNKNRTIVFQFPEGYYLMNCEEPHQTGTAKMQCHIIDEEIDGFSVSFVRGY